MNTPAGFGFNQYRPQTPTWSNIGDLRQPHDFFNVLHGPNESGFFNNIFDRMRSRQFGGGLGTHDAYGMHQQWMAGVDRHAMSPMQIGGAAASEAVSVMFHHRSRFHQQTFMEKHIARENCAALAIAYARQ